MVFHGTRGIMGFQSHVTVSTVHELQVSNYIDLGCSRSILTEDAVVELFFYYYVKL